MHLTQQDTKKANRITRKKSILCHLIFIVHETVTPNNK